jgi:hypothetical protein
MMPASDQPWAMAAEIERDTVRDVMALPAGRRMLIGMITPVLLAGSYVPGDHMATVFNEGRRSIVLELLAKLDRVAPEFLLLARREELDEMQRALVTKQQEIIDG